MARFEYGTFDDSQQVGALFMDTGEVRLFLDDAADSVVIVKVADALDYAWMITVPANVWAQLGQFNSREVFCQAMADAVRLLAQHDDP